MGSDGRVLKVLEGENPDPFDASFITALFQTLYGPPTTYFYDINYNPWILFNPPMTPSGSPTWLTMGPCLVNCPNMSNSPPNGPGFLFYGDYPDFFLVGNYYGTNSITNAWPPITSGIAYSPVIIHPSTFNDLINATNNPVTLTISQTATNVSGSPIEVYAAALYVAIGIASTPSPVLIPVSFFIFSPPLVWSPGVTLAVSVMYTFEYGVQLLPRPVGVIFTG
jgi:hypothetical protein